MAKSKKKLTAAQRAEKKRRKREFMTIFIRGKQVRVRRPSTIEGISEDEFIRRNADPIGLHQHGYYEILHEQAMSELESMNKSDITSACRPKVSDESDDIPF